MKTLLILVSFLLAGISMLPAQLPPGLVADPVTVQTVNDMLPPQWQHYSLLIVVGLMILARWIKGYQVGKRGLGLLFTPFTGSTVAKAPLILAGFCLLSLSSCSFFTAIGAYAMTPAGRVALAGIEAIAVSIEHKIEAPEVAKLIADAQSKIKKLPAKTGNPATDLGRDLQEQGWQKVIGLGQARYMVLTGAKYVVPNIQP